MSSNGNGECSCTFGYIQRNINIGVHKELTLVWEDETGNWLPGKLQRPTFKIIKNFDEFTGQYHDDVLITLSLTT